MFNINMRIEVANKKEVPVLIFSAGLADIIEEVLRQKLHRCFKNVKIVSNSMMQSMQNLSYVQSRANMWSQLEKLTNNYDEKNFIGRTQFGKLYRGKINSPVNGVEPRDMTVKIWDEEREKLYVQADCYAMFKDEVMFLRDPTVNYHPNLVKIIGYCDGRVRDVVYDVKPVDTLHNLTTKECFTWPQRIKTVLCFAHLLEFLHGQAKQYLLLNISAAHIVLDKDWNPILLDFSTMSGGVLGERGPDKKHIPMAFGYVDPFLASTGTEPIYMFVVYGISKHAIGTFLNTSLVRRASHVTVCSVVKDCSVLRSVV
ncbi:hypothetical protein Vadar_001076 [Vaccinium darrowii]|uniref:Uncharacterized protein n=1 Tax=Vaccinium darrowii TaxID=229202 RepID=A0ACB7XEI5_9ERIC|nr:hypothetical protein Vadar_001076 [Vaccinium darrowii]